MDRDRRSHAARRILRLACAFAASFTALSSLPASARAAEPDAAALYDRGVERMKAGNYAEGCPDLAASFQADPRPGKLFTLATCEDRWGHRAIAIARYEEYLAVFAALPEEKKASQTERPEIARTRRDALTAEIPELSLALPDGAPAGTVITRDGALVPASALGVKVRVEPGDHVVTVQVPGGVATRQTITLQKGEKKSVIVAIGAPPIAAPPVTPAVPDARTPVRASGPGGQRIAAFVVGGAGVAGLVIGGVMGGLALQKKGTVDRYCGPQIDPHDPSACGDQRGVDAANASKGLALGSTIGFVAGGTAIATAAILLLTAPRSAKPSARAPRWSPAVLAAGSEGAVLGARGAF